MALPPYSTPGQRATDFALRIFTALCCAFFILPLLVYIPISFSAGAFFHYPIPGFSLRWYVDLFTSPGWITSLVNTLIVAAGTAVLATGLGVVASIGLWMANFPGKRAVTALLISPMVVPVIIAAVGIYYAFARIGLNNSLVGLIIAHTAIASPFVVVTVSATLSRFDATLLRAAASLGASPTLAFRRVMLPLILPGVVSGAIFAIAASFDDVVIALFLTGPQERTLPVQMFIATKDNFRLTIAAAATVMFLVALMLMTVVELLRRRSERLAAPRIQL